MPAAGRSGANGYSPRSTALIKDLTLVLEPYNFGEADIYNLLKRCGHDAGRIQAAVSNILDDHQGHEMGAWATTATASEKKANAAEAKRRRELREKQQEEEADRLRELRRKADEERKKRSIEEAQRRRAAEEEAKNRQHQGISTAGMPGRAAGGPASCPWRTPPPDETPPERTEAHAGHGAEWTEEKSGAGSMGGESTQEMTPEPQSLTPQELEPKQEYYAQANGVVAEESAWLITETAAAPEYEEEYEEEEEEEEQATTAAAAPGAQAPHPTPWSPSPPGTSSDPWGARPKAWESAWLQDNTIAPETEQSDACASAPPIHPPTVSMADGDLLDEPCVIMPPSYAALVGNGPEPVVLFGSVSVNIGHPQPLPPTTAAGAGERRVPEEGDARPSRGGREKVRAGEAQASSTSGYEQPRAWDEAAGDGKGRRRDGGGQGAGRGGKSGRAGRTWRPDKPKGRGR
eukprot:gnl/TRDRNA2_/TRDRNA2_42156_c0_seq1.p1 gnl/TRDRNA2_/TRDRNA2_42156_c0~~gnl/TRDRNA2_/TRDRNA2_42156_c0_seq1.p1  ORF type:complete len:506 (+),score=109.04 gnl/TRDRNA2_/TRDRNA2_42156_c0_seq1:138-1520(+)